MSRRREPTLHNSSQRAEMCDLASAAVNRTAEMLLLLAALSFRPPLQSLQTSQHRSYRLGTPCATEVDVDDTPPLPTPPPEQNIIDKARDAFLFIPSQTLKAVNQGIFASGGADQSSGEVTTTQKIAVAAVAISLLIADQLGSSKYVISHAVEAVYGGPHLFVTGTSIAADNKLYEEALAAGRVASLDEWYRGKLIAQYVESGQCPDAATSEWCARNAPK